MKAAQISQYGHPDAVKIVEVEEPTIGSDQVLVEVYASSLNPWDTIVREGYAQSFLPLELPVTLGGDLSGVVAKVGADVQTVAVGDEVFGTAGVPMGSGALAEFAATKPEHLAKKPTTVSYVEAAAATLTGVSAYQALVEHLKLATGQKVLIHGGAGGIGSLAIQIAKNIGAYVATTATGDGVAFAKSLGADEVIDYKTESFDELIHDYDAVFDTVAGETFERSFKVVKKGGMIVSMNAQPNPELAEKYGVETVHQQTHTTTDALEALGKLIDDGVVKVQVDHVFPLADIQAAFEARESTAVKGKIAVEIKK